MKTEIKFLAATIIAIGALSMADTASAQTYQNGHGFLVNYDNGKCADFAAGDLSNNVTLQQWPCGGLSAYNQQWFLGRVADYPNNTPAVYFQNARNYTCMAVENDSLANGARVVQRICDPSNPSQHWLILSGGFETQRTRLMNGRSGKCLDIWNNNNGTVYQQYTCASSSNWGPQGFFFRAIYN